jgi:Rrf2 family protein
MTKLNKKLEYALMALKYFADLTELAKQGQVQESVSAKSIAEHTHAPYEVTARVLQVLSSHGVLKAEYGTQGGYRLAKDLKKINLHDLIHIIEGSTELANCLVIDKECDLHKKCTITSPVQNLNKKVQEFYKSISVEEVLHV